MGSATREALSASRASLDAVAKPSLELAEQLFSAGRIIGESTQLRTILTETNGDPENKTNALTAVFGQSLGADATAILTTVVENRWSSGDDLLAGIEELGLRAAAVSAAKTTSIGAELFSFGSAVSSDPQLELALGSKLGSDEAKSALIDALLGKASQQTAAIVRQLVLQPRGRRIGELLRNAAAIVADQAGASIATVTSATPIGTAQLARLQKGLATSFGRELAINLVVDPSIIGGLRVQVGDDVIDGTVARKLAELRLQLAG